VIVYILSIFYSTSTRAYCCIITENQSQTSTQANGKEDYGSKSATESKEAADYHEASQA
jgi:hypothetical protein